VANEEIVILKLSAVVIVLEQTSVFILNSKGKGEAVLLQAWSGPEGSRKLRFPDFHDSGTGWR
jgi:hypothetical protein